MTGVWWGKEAVFEIRPPSPSGLAKTNRPPELAFASRQSVTASLLSRIAAYTPEWTCLAVSDAGIALARLFGEQMEPVLGRLNRLLEKAFVEFLNMAGVEPLPARPAETLLEFEVADSAPHSLLISSGFQVGANPAQGGDPVVFETQRAIYAAPAPIVEMHLQQGSRFQAINFKGDVRFLPFGQDAIPGRALFIGFAGNVVPGPVLSLGFRVAAPPGAPPPVSAGGIAPLPVPPPPMLRWEVLDGGSFEPADVIFDETGGFFRSGVVELGIPRRWRVSSPEGMEDGPPLRWLRIKIVHGRYREPPALLFIKPNMVRARATRTIRDEVLEPVPGSGGRRWRLSQTPVIPGSLVLEVDEGITDLVPAATGLIGSSGGQTPSGSLPWRAVDDLSAYGADDRVYVLDPLTGEVSFGDGVHGAAAPVGFRHIRADIYQVGGGKAGVVDAEAVNTLLSSVPFVKSAKNPLPSSGGTDQESREQVMARGPQEIRARGRAVTVTDYALFAQRTPGAEVQRAHAVAGLHPAYTGRPIPGVVGVFVVPPDRGEGPPTPDEGTLRAVTEFLSQQVAPAGVEVVAAAPVYHRMRTEVGLVIERTANMADTVGRVVATLNRYLDPLRGGDQGNGWPFGGTLRYSVLLRLIANVGGVHAVPRLNLVLDGIRVPACQDCPITAHSLLWPEGHEVAVIDTAEAP